jgi:hypothetical protein
LAVAKGLQDFCVALNSRESISVSEWLIDGGAEAGAVAKASLKIVKNTGLATINPEFHSWLAG